MAKRNARERAKRLAQKKAAANEADGEDARRAKGARRRAPRSRPARRSAAEGVAKTGPAGAPAATGRAKAAKYVYFFGGGKAEGNRTMKDTARRQGRRPGRDDQRRPAGAARLHDLHRGLQPLLREPRQAPAGHRERDRCAHIAQAREARQGARSGDQTNPLLVSVRSGAKFSMPGMMDTILNLGLNDAAVEGLKARTGNGRFAFDSYRRFIQMFGNVVLEIPKDAFEHEFEAVKKAVGAKLDTDLDEAGAARRRRRATRPWSRTKTGKAFPQDPLRAAPHGARRRVPLVEQPAREGIPPHLRHPGPHRHGRQRAGDGVRQHGRPLGHRRRLHAQPGHRREGVLRRVPRQRAGRGRRRRHPHAAADRRARAT